MLSFNLLQFLLLNVPQDSHQDKAELGLVIALQLFSSISTQLHACTCKMVANGEYNNVISFNFLNSSLEYFSGMSRLKSCELSLFLEHVLCYKHASTK